MNRSYTLVGIAAIMVGATITTSLGWAAITATPEEMQKRNQWAKEWLTYTGLQRVPFSFVMGGQVGSDVLNTWPKTIEKKALDDTRTQHTLRWMDPKTGLEVRCAAVEYSDFPVVEWTVYFKNTGKTDTPILENLQALNALFTRDEGPEFVLHSIKGDYYTADSYQPFQQMLAPQVNQRFAPEGGRPTNLVFPYFNLQMPGGGMMFTVGWPGQWAVSLMRNAERGVRIIAGQERTHLCLKPGEEVRTPLMVLFFWSGTDVQHAQNHWRRWMLAYDVPHPGKVPAPMYSFCDGLFFPHQIVSEADEKRSIDMLTREGIKLDYWWMDAAWYSCSDWDQVGTWEFDKKRFPKGIKAISDYVHERGAKLILWFEPERVAGNTWLSKKTNWLTGPGLLANSGLLNLGNPEACQWLTDHIDRFITEQGVDLYRQDFNMDPLKFWRENDSPDRQGITENLHVQGYLAYWDELRRRHPGMLIDSCASGGRRNDLETLRRAMPLGNRSDYYQPPDWCPRWNPSYALGNQGHTYGLSSWIPYQGTFVMLPQKNLIYCVRSSFCPSFGIWADVRRNDTDWNLYRQMVKQWRQVAGCMLGDYYPLTPYSLQYDQWIAWQFDRPESGDGMVQAFRREKNEETARTVRLSGLDPAAQYEVTDLDVGTPEIISGKKLTEQGLAVEIKTKPGAVVITYKKLR